MTLLFSVTFPLPGLKYCEFGLEIVKLLLMTIGLLGRAMLPPERVPPLIVKVPVPIALLIPRVTWPLLRVKPPVKVFALDSFSVPVPDLVRL